MKTRQAEAIVFPEAGQVEVRTVTLPEAGPGDLVVRTLYTMVSSGTELRVRGGHYGAQDNFPLVPGYSVVGEVVEVGDAVKGWRRGDLLTAAGPKAVPGLGRQWGGHASLHIYDAGGTMVKLPDGADPLDYVVAEIGSISGRGLRAAEPKVGETVVVIGQGLIGALSAAQFAAAGCRVIVTDVSPRRLERATKWAAMTIDAREPDAVERALASCAGGPDIVVESSGTTRGFQTALRLIARDPWAPHNEHRWPRLLLQANYVEPVPINPFAFFEGEGLRLLTPIDRRKSDRIATVELLRRGALRSADFIDRIVSCRDAADAYRLLADRPDECFSVVFDFTGEAASLASS